MTSDYVCPSCHRLASISGELNTWILSWCRHCGFAVEVKVIDGPTVICEEEEG